MGIILQDLSKTNKSMREQGCIKSRLLIGLLIGLAWSSTLFSQSKPRSVATLPSAEETRALFQNGVNLYNAEKYWEAEQLFQQIQNLPRSENRFYTASQFMLIKTAYRLGNWEKCQSLANSFLTENPTSRYINEVQFTLAELLLAQEQYSEAFRLYLKILQSTENSNLQQKVDDALTLLSSYYFSAEDLRRWRDDSDNIFVRQYLTLRLAERYYSEGDVRQAGRELHSLDGSLNNNFIKKCYLAVENDLKKAPLPPKFIGVVLPLSGTNASIGQKILTGLKFALSQYRQKNGNIIGAIVIDNRSEVIQTARAAEILAKNPRVIALFGPVTSEAATAMALIANSYHIPMITPTASGSQLSSLSPYVYQANLDYENIGRFLGQYGVKVSGVKTVAAIAPADEFGKEITDAFCRTVDELGGRVISQQWYLGEPTDLKYQINAIRNIATDYLQSELNQKLGNARQQLLRLVQNDPRFISDTLRFIVGENNCYLFKRDTTIRLSFKDALLYTGLLKPADFEIPKRDTVIFSPKLVDGFLLPSRANDVNLIVPQLNYYDIKVPLFGSGNWNDLQLLKSNREILKNLRFISDYYIDAESKSYKTFQSGFVNTFHTEPGRFELYGYDTMGAILSLIEDSKITRPQLHQSLQTMSVYRGIARNISFQGNRPRVNSCAFILSFERDKIRPVATIENGKIIVGNKVIP